MEDGQGFGVEAVMDGSGRSCAGAGLLPEVEGGPDKAAPPVSVGKGYKAYRFGIPRVGRGPDLRLGRIRSDGLFTFFISFVFPFSVFLFHSKLFQNSSKRAQTSF
jgi:hypothetical protein